MFSLYRHQVAQSRRSRSSSSEMEELSSQEHAPLRLIVQPPYTTLCEPSQAVDIDDKRILSKLGSTKEECKACLWTGVITCTGLSAYFAYAAFDPPLPHETLEQVLRQRRPLYLVISAGWLCLGAYRWHLG